MFAAPHLGRLRILRQPFSFFLYVYTHPTFNLSGNAVVYKISFRFKGVEALYFVKFQWILRNLYGVDVCITLACRLEAKLLFCRVSKVSEIRVLCVLFIMGLEEEEWNTEDNDYVLIELCNCLSSILNETLQLELSTFVWQTHFLNLLRVSQFDLQETHRQCVSNHLSSYQTTRS